MCAEEEPFDGDLDEELIDDEKEGGEIDAQQLKESLEKFSKKCKLLTPAEGRTLALSALHLVMDCVLSEGYCDTSDLTDILDNL